MAIDEIRAAHRNWLQKPAPRARRYDRRALCKALEAYELPKPGTEQAKETFEPFIRCPGCGRGVRERHLVLNASQTGYVCERCAGYGQ